MILEGHFQIGRLASCHTAQSLFQHTCTEKKNLTFIERMHAAEKLLLFFFFLLQIHKITFHT